MHIVVTGASSGIGRSIARAFGTADNTLSLVARRQPELEALAGEVAARCEVIPADLAAREDPIAWLRRAEEALRATHVLVPLARMPLPLGVRPGVHGVRATGSGALIVEHAWIEP